MEKWSEKRIAATQQYLNNIESQLETWQERLTKHTSGKKSAETMVVALKESRDRTIESLKAQGVYQEGVIEEPAAAFATPPDIEQFIPGVEELPADIEQRRSRGAGRTYIRHRAAKGEKKLYDEQ